jgi:hypothetical protein
MKKTLLLTASAAVMAFGMSLSAMAADVPTDYEAYFTFDETIDDATAIEQGSNGQVGATTTKEFNYVDGKNGKAIAINDTTDEEGNTDNIGLDTNVTLDGSDTYTISFWAKASDAPFAAPIVWVGAESQSPENWVGIWAGFNSGEWQSAAGIGSNDSSDGEHRVNLVAPIGTLNSFGWDYITLVVDENHMATLYYNGVSQGTTEEAIPTLVDGSHVYLGANAWDAPANMEIDDLVIFKRALSAEEIQALYEVNGVPDADAEVVEQEETTTAAKKKVSTAAGGVDDSSSVSDSEDSDNSTAVIIIIVVAVLVVAVVVAVVVAGKKKKS